MSKKLSLQWNDFKANVHSSFRRLRSDIDFTDVTLACEDGRQMEAHKVILASWSPFFETILQQNKHPHPLIYMRGVGSDDLLAILDFLYFGEASVSQENLNSFMAIADELKLKELATQTSREMNGTEKNIFNPDTVPNTMDQSKPVKTNESHESYAPGKKETTRDISDDLLNCPTPGLSYSQRIEKYSVATFSGDLQDLDKMVKSMMEKGRNKLPHGRQPDGKPKHEASYICKVCGKENVRQVIMKHIENKHVEGISIQCDICGKTFSSRDYLRQHKLRLHK